MLVFYLLLVVVGGVAMYVSIFKTQVVNGDMWRKKAESRERIERTEEARRGTIFSSDDKVLATTVHDDRRTHWGMRQYLDAYAPDSAIIPQNLFDSLFPPHATTTQKETAYTHVVSAHRRVAGQQQATVCGHQ